MTPETMDLEDAKKLLSLPREVGVHPEGGEIVAQNGRYGPYLTWGKETRSLESEDEIFSVDLAKALALFAEPKARGRRAAARPLAELGQDPISKREVVVRSGRFGLYVTDGETNATLRPETISLDRACELLAERRNAEPSTRVRKAAKKTTKKAPAKKTAKKSTKAAKKKVPTKATGATKRAAVAQGAKANAALVQSAHVEDD
jgi:DNA topoisomerase-1